MTFTLTVETDNDAFHDADGDHYPGPELVRIMGTIINRIMATDEPFPMKILDRNGTTVGRAELTP